MQKIREIYFFKEVVTGDIGYTLSFQNENFRYMYFKIEDNINYNNAEIENIISNNKYDKVPFIHSNRPILEKNEMLFAPILEKNRQLNLRISNLFLNYVIKTATKNFALTLVA